MEFKTFGKLNAALQAAKGGLLSHQLNVVNIVVLL